MGFAVPISIHALVKRATEQALLKRALGYISIHALVKRATSIFGDVLRRMAISIHALVKRATVRTCPRILRSSNFNPRPREEGDVIDNVLESFVIISIHALVKRATPYLHA